MRNAIAEWEARGTMSYEQRPYYEGEPGYVIPQWSELGKDKEERNDKMAEMRKKNNNRIIQWGE